MKIYNANDGLILEVAVDDSSFRYRAIMGDHTLTLRYALAEHCELPVGAYCVFQGQRYTLERPEDFKMVSSRNFDYTVVFQSTEYKARIWKFRNPVDGRLKFSLTAKPREHLQMFVDNMNRRDTGWTVGNCIDGAEVCINYDHDFCRDALARIATELKTEYHFNGKTVSLCKLEANKDRPLPLSYGRGNGFKSGVGRTNSGDNPPTEILYVQGGTDNIDRSVYPPLNEERVRAASAGCLLLPRLASLQFDGDHFEDEDGFNPDLAHTYITDDLGLSLRRADKELSSLAEDSLDCSSIYPKRVGTVSEVFDVKGDGTVWDIVDNTIPESLNFEDCIIGDETLSIIFQSGMLAGKEFDVKYCHEASNINGNAKKGRRFEIVPQEIDGLNMPGDCFVPVKGDTYAVFHCNLPQSYINAYTGNAPEKKGAEWDMFRMAVKHLYEAEQLHFTFSGVLDGIWAKKDWGNIGGRIVLGGYVLFTDPQFEKEGARVRITGIKDYVNNPHSPEIELSNSAISASVSATLKELAAEDVTVQENHRDALQFTRRRFRDAQEIMSLIEKALLANFSESINPVAVHTMQMLVGDESLQFEFVDRFPVEGSIIKPQTVNHIVKWDNATRTLNVPSGIIRHLTLDLPKDLSSEVAPTTYHYWGINGYRSGELDNPSQQYYLYARVPYNGTVGEFRLIEATVPQLPPFRTGNEVWLLMGVLNSEYGGERSYASLYGFTEILPGRITTDRVVSGDGQSWFDMAANSMKLGDRLSFNKNGDGQLLLRGTLVQSQSGDTEYIGCFRGEYDPNVTYFQGDEVTYSEVTNATVSTYRCIVTSCKGVQPTTSTSWQVIAQGSQGTPGVSPNTSFKATAFYRTNKALRLPVGGSYSNPVPDGWSDGVPSGEEKLYMTTRIFSSDGNAPQQSEWTAPVAVTDTADLDLEFSSVEAPDAPTGHPNTNPQWSNTASEDTIWMATSRKKNGVWGDWQVARIKGENGADGSSIKIKGNFSGHFTTESEFYASGITSTQRGGTYLVDRNTDAVTEDTKFLIVHRYGVPRPGAMPGWMTRYAEEGDSYILENDSTEAGCLFVANDAQWTNVGVIKGADGNPGADGKNAYLHIKYANSLTRGDWTDNNGETPGRYIGVYSDNNVADPPCNNATWDLFTWSKWEGQDGLGYEYIYKRTTTNSAPDTPTATSQQNDYVPSGWTDDPSGVSSAYPYEWQCYRKKTDGVWGAFIGSSSNNAKAALWAKYGNDGKTGDYTVIRYAANGSPTSYPTFNSSSLDTSIWLTSLTSAQSQGQYVWQTTARFNSSGVRQTAWTTPIRLTGEQGSSGEQGYSPACVYRGEYDPNTTYVGTRYRVDVVKAKGKNEWYVARTDAGEFKGIAPPDTSKWGGFGGNFESIATNLLLAENANIGGWIFKNGKLQSQSGGCWLDGKTGNVLVKGDFIGGISTASSGVRIAINPNDSTIRIISNYNGVKDVEVFRIESEDIGMGLRRPRIIMNEVSTSGGEIMGTMKISAYETEYYRYDDTSQPFFKITGGWSSKKIILGDLALPTSKPTTKGQIWRSGDTLKIVT